MAEPLYCALASNSISFGYAGGSRPCCAVDTHFWRERKHQLSDYPGDLIGWFNNEELVKVRKDLLEGKWNPVCNLCKTREQHGQASTRQIFNNTLTDWEEKLGKNLRESSPVSNDLSNIFLLDITIGSKCNSACLMCNGSASSLWRKEQEEITGSKMFWLGEDWFSEENVPDLIDNLPNLRAIQFVGGEPTINDAHIYLLKRLIEQGKSKNITLGYVTNLTGISDELLELWSHFDTKHITISVDGVGPVNEYIRYPFSWAKVSSQIKVLKDIAATHGKYSIGLSHTVTSLNLTRIDELIDWWETEIASSPSMLKSLPHIQCVNNPEFFDPIYMSTEMKEEGKRSLDRLRLVADKHGCGEKYLPAINNILNTVLNKVVDEEERVAHWLKMQDFVTSLDRYRKRNIFDYLPYMKEYWL